MIATVAFGRGSHYTIGFTTGKQALPFVRANVTAFWRAMEHMEVQHNWLIGKAREEVGLLASHIVDEIAGLAEGSRLAFEDVLAYNLYGDYVFSDGCTVMMAIGEAGHNGNTLFMKNSDQVGNDSMVGDGFDQNKEIYVIQVVDPDEGNRMIGVSAAGRTGIKVGVNDKGVATGSNIARTIEFRERKMDISQVRASDRTQLMRQGLEKDNAYDAANLISRLLMENPTSTPGNIEFADSDEGIIIEGSYSHQAIDVVRNQTAARANRFQLLEYTNMPEDVSSVCRYQRCLQLLKENEGKLTLEKFMEFSRDHANGPSQNSICRHGNHYREETSLGAAVIEIDREAPEKSTISMALGKPCHAWRSPDGYITMSVDANASEIPTGFFDGGIWKKFYSEEPILP